MSTPNTETFKYAEFVGRKVAVTVKDPDGGEPKTREGTVFSVAKHGILLIPKGKSAGDIIFGFDIVDLIAKDSDISTKPKRLAIVPTDKVRQHLLDRHGYAIQQVEALTNEEAEVEHNQLHADLELGHYHGDAPAKSDAAA